MRSSGQSFWLQIQRSRVQLPVPPDSLKIMGQLSFVKKNNELLERRSNRSGLENRVNGRWDPLH
jgi:hypothetical protein